MKDFFFKRLIRIITMCMRILITQSIKAYSHIADFNNNIYAIEQSL